MQRQRSLPMAGENAWALAGVMLVSVTLLAIGYAGSLAIGGVVWLLTH